MKRHAPGSLAVCLIAASAMLSSFASAHAATNDRIQSFCIDFNWGAGGPNGFPAPGTFASADPAVHYQFYKDLGVNVIQTFCVSCNGYAWYQGSAMAPVQPGLKHDFLKQITALAHKDGIKVMGYFCVGANTYWGQKHPDQSYGIPSGIHIPFTRDYLDYLAGCIEDALTKTGIDGFMIDWAFSPPLLMDEKNVRWLPCEQTMYAELFDRPFPGKDKVDARETLEFQRRALERCWRRIQQAAKSTKPDCIIWLSCFDLAHPQVVGTAMLREVDWVMNETPTPEKLDATRQMVGPHARLIQCVSGGSTEYDASKVLDNPKYQEVGLYGFAPWPDPQTTLPPDPPQDATQKNIRANIEKLRRVFRPAAAAAAPAVKLARPTPQQYAWHEQERIMFACLDPATWQGREYDNHSTPLSAINPTQLDTDQWCRAAKLWGAKEILFVAKHTGGFCWWQTETTKYGIKDTAWKGGKGDVLAELADACRRHGLTLGIYVYPGDDTWGAPMGSGGRTKDPAKQEAYNQVFRQQLTEVLTRYGKITEVWFDGSCVIDVRDILKQHAAEAVIFQGPSATIRWPGTESGKLPYPAWNSLPSQDLKTGVATAAQGDPDGDAWAPLEADTTLYDHNWFWAADNEKKRKSLNELMDIYYKSAGHGGVLLLNSTPNTNGLIPDGDLKLYEAFGKEIERRFSQAVAEVNDQRGPSVELGLPQPTTINHAVIMEDYREGERIREYIVEGLRDGQWKELSRGTSVGRKKIDRFRPAEVSRVRLRVTRFAAEPIIRRLAVFQVEGLSAGSLISSLPAHDWQRCGEWTAASFRDGKATLTLDLSPFIPKPGQYEVKFEQAGGQNPFRILNATLFYEGEAATPGLLTRFAAAHSFNVNRTAQVTKETSSVLKVAIAADGTGDCAGTVWIRPQVGDARAGAAVLKPETFRHYVDAFNRNDRETVINHIPNAKAWDWLTQNVPLFECPDPDLEEIYYFRWWTYRKHIKQTPDGFIVTEFLPPVPWSGKHNSINCPAGHHFYEGRWLHDPRYLDDYAVFWFRKGGEPRKYSFWAADAMDARFQVQGDDRLPKELLPDLIANYEAWEKDHLDACGLFWQNDGNDGMEVAIGGSGCRATINSYQFGDAMAISRIAERAGQADLARRWREKAVSLKQLMQDKLWDREAQFYKVLPRGSTNLANVRELHGYTPWYFNLPDPDQSAAWKQLLDPQGFFAPYGPTTAEQRHPGFKVAYAGHECQWNGPSWPLATAVTLTAMANLLNHYSQNVVGKADYWKTFQCYLRSHRFRQLPPATQVPRLTRSYDNSVPRHTWWAEGRLGGTEWVQYDFPAPVRIEASEVFWYDDPHGIDPPAAWRILAQDGNEWREVKATNPYGNAIDCYNRVGFEPVTTKALRLEARTAAGKSAGILDWRVFQAGTNVATAATPSASYSDIYAAKLSALNHVGQPLERIESRQPWIDENLNPYTGDWIARTLLKQRRQPPDERGKDYNHSTFCDLVISGLVGLRPRADDVVEVNPLVPDGTWDYFCLDRVLYHGQMITILYDKTGERYGKGKGLQVFANGRRVAGSDSLQRVTGSLKSQSDR